MESLNDYGDHQEYCFRFMLDCYCHFYFSSSPCGHRIELIHGADLTAGGQHYYLVMRVGLQANQYNRMG
jgi:hypothetical protein